MSAPAPVVLWFGHDLRLTDQAALVAAVRSGAPIIPLFIAAPEEQGPWQDGAASRWWLHHSLTQLQAALRARGSRLIVRQGPVLEVLRSLQREAGIREVYWTRRYEPAARERERTLSAALQQLDISTHVRGGALLFEPEIIHTQQGAPYQVFTPFWRRCLEQPLSLQLHNAPKTIAAPRRWPQSLPLEQLQLLPRIDWSAGLAASWQPGEAGAGAQLRRFLAHLADYDEARDRPDRPGTSRLSPHLHFGEISVQRVWSVLQRRRASLRAGAALHSLTRYCTELGWREFAHHLLFHFPDTPQQPLRAPFAKFPWLQDEPSLKAWQRGRTGYPVVDAGMRELWHTGWMHNRVRMIVASFLVKDLLIHWLQGARWFWDTLVDADLANNTLGWQWGAGCGADAAPYFRIFNPTTQGQRFDPDGAYVRRWVPELAALPTQWIHDPASAPGEVLAQAGVRLGHHYPHPIVEHRAARARALAAFERIKG